MCITERHISNQRRAITHCPKGHEYSPENTGIDPKTKNGHGGRFCRLCRHEKYEAKKEQVKTRATKWAKENPERRKEILRKSGFLHDRKWGLKSRHGMSLEDYQQRFNEQNGVCKICRKPEPKGKPLHVDHDHETEQIRGLLCGSCNRAIGLFHDDVEALANAVIYLGSSRGDA